MSKHGTKLQIYIFWLVTWTRTNSQWCTNSYGYVYPTLEEARNFCQNDSFCKGIYDHGCNGGWKKCGLDGVFQSSSSNSCTEEMSNAIVNTHSF